MNHPGRRHQCIVTSAIAILAASLLWSNIVHAGADDGTILGSTRIVDNGPDAERFNLVILSEGFTASQQEEFNTRVSQLVTTLLGYPPLDSMNRAFNIFRINVASDDSGADMPPPCDSVGLYVDTYFDATFCAYGVQRALTVDKAIVYSVLNTWVPAWDQAVVLVNSHILGGTGGVGVAVMSTASDWAAGVVHELGHAAFGLADEYEFWAGCNVDTTHDYHSGDEPAYPNVTCQLIRSLIKWNDLILPTTPVPTTENANCAICDPQSNPFPPSTIGTFEGAHYYHCMVYRPLFSCLMRNLQSEFCAVCRREVVNGLSPYLPPPNQAPVAVCRNLTVSSDDNCEATVLPAEVDNGSFDPDGTGLDLQLVPEGPYPLGVTTVALIVSDGDLSDTCEAIITVADTTAPALACPSDIVVTVGPGVSDTIITYSPTVFDACGGVSVSVSPPSGSVFQEGASTVQCVGVDSSGNEDTCQFIVHIDLTGCSCPYPCDLDADGFHTALDLSILIDVLFAGGIDPADSQCPITRADFDCDGFATAIDLGELIDQLFAGGEPPCDPCADFP